MNCTEENPVVDMQVVEVLPTELESRDNSYNKADFDSGQVAAQITRLNTKWNDSESGNAADTAGTVTYSYSAATCHAYI